MGSMVFAKGDAWNILWAGMWSFDINVFTIKIYFLSAFPPAQDCRIPRHFLRMPRAFSMQNQFFMKRAFMRWIIYGGVPRRMDLGGVEIDAGNIEQKRLF
jgi:hypothetical protein